MEKPILFSAPMVRAIIEGRKTQTRRVVKPCKDLNFGCQLKPNEIAGEINAGDYSNSRYGKPGDQLWVRETWQGPLLDGDTMENEYRGSPDDFHKPEYCVYAADGGATPEFITQDDELVCRWRPSIHMPRWASRILLNVTGVRIERLNDISEKDAESEGVPAHETARAAYANLWNELNGADSWAANPWVWVISFEVVKHG